MSAGQLERTMSEKRALIVDDSRSARAFLGRILERHNLVVDMVESAEEAIEYLSHHQPDVIFMDHLMPGMDGLQAVKRIKSDSRTAMIPILMYTSQEGELYLSQARALGAIGVLPKQTRPGDVTKALIQLRLVEDRRVPESPSGTDEIRRPVLELPAAAPNVQDSGADTLTPELRRLVAALLDDHSSEMRRFVVEHLESHADRIVGDVRHMLQDDAGPAVPAATVAGDDAEGSAPPRTARSGWMPLLIALAVVFVAASIWFWQQLMSSQLEMTTQLNSARSELNKLQSRLQSTSRELSEARAVSNAPMVRELHDSYVELVPFGEAPLSGARVEHIQARLERLLAEGFHGRVQILSYAGRFCQESGDAMALPDRAVPYAQCAASTTPAAGAVRESVAFANMLAALRRKSGNTLEFSLLPGAADELAVSYPQVTEHLTTGEWNAAALLNNRVEVSWDATP
jgi:CheY-like chemotaxis protein